MNKRFLLAMQRILWGLDILIITGVFFLIQRTLVNKIIDWKHLRIWSYLFYVYIVWFLVAWLGSLYAEKTLISFELFFRRTSKVYFVWFIFLGLFLSLSWLNDNPTAKFPGALIQIAV